MRQHSGPPDREGTFVGRAAALDALAGDLEIGVLTLTGPPGSGKSRWASELSRHPRPQDSGAWWWVDLEAAPARTLTERVAIAVRAPTSPGVPAEASLLVQLRAATGVLVLDGCDGMRREVAELVGLIRHRCPGVRLLITCREALAVPGERVRSLACADPAASVAAGERPTILWSLDDAVALLRLRVGPAAWGAVGERAGRRLCRAVAGLPAAVELVAARAVRMPPAEIDSQLIAGDEGCRAGGRAPRELVAVIRWSYGLLSDTDRRVLARLSVFPGAFSVEDAEAVAGENQEPGAVTLAIGRLIEAALLRGADRSHHHRGLPRQASAELAVSLVLSTPVRLFAAAELSSSGESARVHRRHAEHWARLASVAEHSLQSRQQEAWVERLERDRDNLLAGLRWLACEPDVEPALRMAGALGRFWWLGGRFEEGWRALRSVLARPGADRRTLGRAAALHALGLATFWHETDAIRARRSGACFEEAVQIYRELGDRPRLVWALRDLGSHHNSAGDLDKSRDLFGQSLALAREVGDVAAMGVAASYLGIAATYAGDRAEARHRFEEAAVLLSGRGGADELVRAQFYLACLECDDRNPTAARARFTALVRGNETVPTLPYVVGFALDGLARLAAVEGRGADALRLSGAAAAAHARWGTSGGRAYAAYMARGLAEARRVVGAEKAAAYAAEGSRWTVAQAVDCGFRTEQDPKAEHARLRPRELEVLRMANEGLGDAEIARRLSVSRRTVGNHLTSAYRKLGVHSRTAALHVIRQRGLLVA